ncbi:BA75_04487T0 [Komagataella pastoris]|uniref:BA75_04487T0 n=1 Tax=Komagataella pastoris TaxID=4922 RepID=A0A1B2JJ28_PICPA|nr:BA75_04487T0 [Komagataella pastoris]
MSIRRRGYLGFNIGRLTCALALKEFGFVLSSTSSRLSRSRTRFIHTKMTSKQEHTIVNFKTALAWINSRQTTLISLDSEWFERNSNVVTEVGISIYKPYIPLEGPEGKHLPAPFLPDISTLHFIVQGTEKVRNKKYVPDNKDYFIGGTSFTVSKKDISAVITEIVSQFDSHDGQKLEKFAMKSPPPVALVGHNLIGDLKTLKKAGITIPILPIIDTRELWLNQVNSPKSNLKYILRRLGLPHSFLHNAANDAYYTLLASLKLAQTSVSLNLLYSEEEWHVPSKTSNSNDFPKALPQDIHQLRDRLIRSKLVREETK